MRTRRDPGCRTALGRPATTTDDSAARASSRRVDSCGREGLHVDGLLSLSRARVGDPSPIGREHCANACRRVHLTEWHGLSVFERQRPQCHVITLCDGEEQHACSRRPCLRFGRVMAFHRELEEPWPPAVATSSRDPQFSLVRTGILPSYSPDGRQLVVNTGRAGNFHNAILTMSADGTNRRVMFDDPNRNAVAPVWSPRGDRIAFGLIQQRARCAAGR